MKNDLIFLVEKTLKNVLNEKNTDKTENQDYKKELRIVSDELIKFYYFYDKLFNTCHSKIIKELYIKSGKEKTLLSESLNLFISERALFNYRKQYCQNFVNILLYYEKELNIGANCADAFKNQLI